MTDPSDRPSRPAHRAQTRPTRPIWACEGGEGLPPAQPRLSDGQVWLFTCRACGFRAANPPAPLTEHCGDRKNVVSHRFPTAEYRRIRLEGDPNADRAQEQEQEPEPEQASDDSVRADGGQTATAPHSDATPLTETTWYLDDLIMTYEAIDWTVVPEISQAEAAAWTQKLLSAQRQLSPERETVPLGGDEQ